MYKTNENKNVAIVGSGISGLSSAYFLAKNSSGNIASLTIFEKSTNIGGVLNYTQENGYLLEHGAQGVLFSRESFSSFIEELSLSDSVLLPEKKHLRRYLMVKNTLVLLSPVKIIRFGLLNFVDFIRILYGFFISKQKIDPNETIYHFFSARFGKKFADTFMIPLSFGIWGGGSKNLSLRHAFPKLFSNISGYGSFFKLMMFTLLNKLKKREKVTKKKGLASFKSGMHFLVQNIYEGLQAECKNKNIDLHLKPQTEVLSINLNRAKETNIIVTFKSNNGTLATSFFHSIIYAGQPWRNAPFVTENLGQEAQKALQVLKNIPSHSIAVVGLGGKKTTHTLSGFGALAGEWSKDILGVLFVHSIYKEHAPDDSFLYRVLLGGDRNPNILQQSDEQLISLAKERLVQFQLIDKETTLNFQKVIRWQNYIPLATQEHESMLSSICQLEALFPGLFFTGNYINGPAVADCIEQAKITTFNVLRYLK